MPKRKPARKSSVQKYTKAEMRAIYDKVRREFTAADLQKYTVIEKTIPARKVLAEMKAAHAADVQRDARRRAR